MILSNKILFVLHNLETLMIWVLATSVIGLGLSIYLRLRSGRILTLVLIMISAPALWILCHAAFHEISALLVPQGIPWAYTRRHPPEEFAYVLCIVAAVSALAIFAELRMRAAAIPLEIATLPPGIAAVAMGVYLVLTY
jgi:hypothetical protein